VPLPKPPNNAAVLGDGIGNIEPPPPGVRPERIPLSFGVSPDRIEGSKTEGPASIAGDKGPDLSELKPQLKEPPVIRFGDGEVIEDAGGSKTLPGVVPSFTEKDCSKGFGSSPYLL